MAQSFFISIVIANYNGEDYLKTCLTSLLKSSFTVDYEILIIDNNSNDTSLEIINAFAQKNPRIRVLKNKTNRGVPYSRNKAIREARGSIMVFLDNDTEVDKNWIQGIVRTFQSDQTIGAAQCKIFDFYRKDIIQEVGMKLIPFTGFGTTLGRGEKDRGQFDKGLEIISLGAALAVRKEVARKIGGFDQKLFHYTDDLDFSWRVWLAGYRVVLAPNAKIYHYTKVHTHNFDLYFNLSKNSIRMLIKNYEFFNVLKFLPMSLSFMVMGSIYVLLKKGSLMGILGNLIGIIWSLFMLPDILKERAKVQKIRMVRDRDISSRMMISTDIISFLKKYFKGERESAPLMKGYQ